MTQHGEAPARRHERDDRTSGARRRRSGSIFDWGDDENRRPGEQRSERSRPGQWGGSGRHEERRHQGGQVYGSDDFHDGLPMDETERLIASNKVAGTVVYGRDGKLGTIFNFMVDKRTGRVAYAVMVWGGFLGLGERYFPIPWHMLTYDERVGGYHIDITERELEDAPSFDRDSEPRFDSDYSDRVHGYYGTRR